MYDFTITYDRHKGQYSYRENNFPESYDPFDSALAYTNDPDWTMKFRPIRLKLKKLIILAILAYYVFDYRVRMVEAFDRRQRKE
jgi:hypothetical protein